MANIQKSQLETVKAILDARGDQDRSLQIVLQGTGHKYEFSAYYLNDVELDDFYSGRDQTATKDVIGALFDNVSLGIIAKEWDLYCQRRGRRLTVEEAEMIITLGPEIFVQDVGELERFVRRMEHGETYATMDHCGKGSQDVLRVMWTLPVQRRLDDLMRYLRGQCTPYLSKNAGSEDDNFVCHDCKLESCTGDTEEKTMFAFNPAAGQGMGQGMGMGFGGNNNTNPGGQGMGMGFGGNNSMSMGGPGMTSTGMGMGGAGGKGSGVCFSCGQPGHISTYCPNKPPGAKGGKGNQTQQYMDDDTIIRRAHELEQEKEESSQREAEKVFKMLQKAEKLGKPPKIRKGAKDVKEEPSEESEDEGNEDVEDTPPRKKKKTSRAYTVKKKFKNQGEKEKEHVPSAALCRSAQRVFSAEGSKTLEVTCRANVKKCLPGKTYLSLTRIAKALGAPEIGSNKTEKIRNILSQMETDGFFNKE